jgi:hypothetical protein
MARKRITWVGRNNLIWFGMTVRSRQYPLAGRLEWLLTPAKHLGYLHDKP